MRHRRLSRNFGRTGSHTKAMFSNMISSLVKHETITTTLPKAKELRRFAERIITKAKEDTLAARRLVFAKLRDDEAVKKLFTTLGPRFKKRPGGYLRVLKSGFRAGDHAPMAIVQLVKDEEKPKAKAKTKTKTTKVKKEKVAAK